MKLLPLLALIALISFNNSFAQEKPAAKDQLRKQVEKIEKSIRHSFYNKRHQDVSTQSEIIDLEATQMKLQNQSNVATRLSEESLNLIMKCAESDQCAVATIDVSSSFHSGYGITLFWVLIDLKTRQKTIIEQLIYSE